MAYRAIPPAERRRIVALRLYADAIDERPDWIEEDLLRPSQVAALFQVSRRTLNDWARRGKLPSIVTPGGHHRFRACDVRALLESQTVPPSREPLHGTHARGAPEQDGSAARTRM